MDRPFREVHELYKILYQRAEAQAAAEEERKKKEAEEEQAKRKAEASRGIKPPQLIRQPPPDAIQIKNNSTVPEPSPLEVDALEEALEDLI